MSTNIVPAIEIRDSSGKLCGTYHYEDPFKSFFRGLYTPSGLNVVACPPPDHPHHKGLQFFEQDVSQANALFVTKYNALEPGSFAFMSFGPTNLHPRTLSPGQMLEGTYIITVADV